MLKLCLHLNLQLNNNGDYQILIISAFYEKIAQKIIKTTMLLNSQVKTHQPSMKIVLRKFI